MWNKEQNKQQSMTLMYQQSIFSISIFTIVQFYMTLCGAVMIKKALRAFGILRES
jgi:hypothetical protein